MDVCGEASLVVISVKFANVATIEMKCLHNSSGISPPLPCGFVQLDVMSGSCSDC